MTYPMPGVAPQIYTPPVRYYTVTCCGYTSHQGIPKPWQCSGCGTVHTEHIPPAVADGEAG